MYNTSRLKKLRNTGILILALVLSSFTVYSQDTFLVKGVVVSQSNEPLANVSVSVEGSVMMPVVTNDSGEFELKAPSGSEWLIINPTGNYKRKRVYLNNREELKIYMTSSDVTSGDDQVTMLFQQFRKRNIITPYAELDISDIHHTSAISIDEFMQGRIAGMNVVNRSGLPGSGAYMSLRGVNSINSSTQPLFIVDGIPLTSHGIFGSNLEGYDYNPLIAINNFDISKATVIKDASLSAVYGSKGSNGLVFIETLDPSVTQTTIELDLRTGYSLAPPRLIPQLDATQHKTLMNEVLFSSGMLEEEIREAYPSLYLTKEDDRYIEYQHNTNWQEIIFDDAMFTNLNLKVKGGDEIARYGLSFGIMNSNGIIKETSFQGYNLRFVSRLNIFTWLKMNAG
ncbi:MAG: TonB-dependent receptor plug domain-containing protein, partial [Bacteroidales bacterium]